MAHSRLGASALPWRQLMQVKAIRVVMVKKNSRTRTRTAASEETHAHTLHSSVDDNQQKGQHDMTMGKTAASLAALLLVSGCAANAEIESRLDVLTNEVREAKTMASEAKSASEAAQRAAQEASASAAKAAGSADVAAKSAGQASQRAESVYRRSLRK